MYIYTCIYMCVCVRIPSPRLCQLYELDKKTRIQMYIYTYQLSMHHFLTYFSSTNFLSS